MYMYTSDRYEIAYIVLIIRSCAHIVSAKYSIFISYNPQSVCETWSYIYIHSYTLCVDSWKLA